MNTIDERKKFMLTVTRKIDDIPCSWNTLSLGIEGRFTNLRIWIGNEKSISDGCGNNMIYMRLDKLNAYSMPFCKMNYLEKENKAINKLLEFYVFGETTIKDLDKILEITKDLKFRETRDW